MTQLLTVFVSFSDSETNWWQVLVSYYHQVVCKESEDGISPRLRKQIAQCGPQVL